MTLCCFIHSYRYASRKSDQCLRPFCCEVWVRPDLGYPDQYPDDIFSIADIIDSQLETRDKKNIGRVADIEAVWGEDGTLILTDLVTGPQALFQRLLRDRFEQRIPLKEVEEFGPTLRLHKKATDYSVGQSERWIADHILRWIPGSGHL